MTRVSTRLTAVDLFAGAGGTGWGLKKGGFAILAAVENDPSAARTYRRNLGVHVRVEDIRSISPSALRRDAGLRKGELDLLVGCPPCQGFTRLRNEEGANDPRNSLILHYLKFVREFQPKYALFENVAGIASTMHGRDYLKRLLRGLRRAGYRVRREILEAADFGVPQLRRRVIVLAARGRRRLALPEATHRDPAADRIDEKRRSRWVTVRETIRNYPRLAPGQKNESRGRAPNHVAAATGRRVKAFLKRVPRDGGSRRDVARRYWLPCHKDHDGHSDTYGRLAWDEPAGTITTGCSNASKGRYVHPTQTRAISLREAAALQSFPDDFVFEGVGVSRQIGNAVPPRLAKAIARKLRSELLRGASGR